MIDKPWLQVMSQDIGEASGGGSDPLVAGDCRNKGTALVNQIGPEIRCSPIDQNSVAHVLAKLNIDKA